MLVFIVILFSPISSSCSAWVGESKFGNFILHRMLWSPPQPGLAHFQGSFADVGRVAARQFGGDAFDREQFGELGVGE